jgi:mRNA-degrading endonuclease toxin of MazEF toxin-antitoxin module
VDRGEVWWANLSPPMGPRPVVLLSRSQAYRARRSIMIAPVTTRSRGIPAEVSLGPEDGLARASVVNLDDITTTPIQTLDRYVTTLSAERTSEVNRAMHFALALD